MVERLSSLGGKKYYVGWCSQIKVFIVSFIRGSTVWAVRTDFQSVVVIWNGPWTDWSSHSVLEETTFQNSLFPQSTYTILRINCVCVCVHYESASK